MVTILVTGVGAPGTVGTLQALRQNPDGEAVRIIGCDMHPEATGKWLCDAFRRAVPADNIDYLTSITDICHREGVDVILPQTTAEVEQLAKVRDRLPCPVVAGSYEAIRKANDKMTLYDRDYVTEWPENVVGRVVVKPRYGGHGGKGQQILDDVIAMPYLDGPEYSVDCFVGAAVRIAVVRHIHQKRGGISTDTEVVENPFLADRALILADKIRLTGLFGIQYKEDTWQAWPIDCNPRIMGTMICTVEAGANLPWMAVTEALGHIVTEIPPIQHGTRYVRQWGGQVIPAEVPA